MHKIDASLPADETQKRQKQWHSAQQVQKKQEMVVDSLTKEQIDTLLDNAVSALDLKAKVEGKVPVVTLVQEVVVQVMQKCCKEGDARLIKTVKGMAGRLVGKAFGAMKRKLGK